MRIAASVLICLLFIGHAYAEDCGRIKNLKAIVLFCEQGSIEDCKETEADIVKDILRHYRITIVNRNNLASILDEKKLAGSGLTSEYYAKIEKITGASHILKFRPRCRKVIDGEDLIIDYTLINLSTSEIEFFKTIYRMTMDDEEVFEHLDKCRKSIVDEAFDDDLGLDKAPSPANKEYPKGWQKAPTPGK